jgi:hypothetical protein
LVNQREFDRIAFLDDQGGWQPDFRVVENDIDQREVLVGGFCLSWMDNEHRQEDDDGDSDAMYRSALT